MQASTLDAILGALASGIELLLGGGRGECETAADLLVFRTQAWMQLASFSVFSPIGISIESSCQLNCLLKTLEKAEGQRLLGLLSSQEVRAGSLSLIHLIIKNRSCYFCKNPRYLQKGSALCILHI
jgi:hypothetical protein